jgi:nitrite reductase (cytochrome c-552)
MTDLDTSDRRERPAPARWLLVAIVAAAGAGTIAVLWVLVTIFQHKQEARTPFVRVADVTEISSDPAPWGLNWPHQYEGYLRTAGDSVYGGSSAMTASKLEEHPWLRRLYAGYAFSIDYREARGHAYMLYDQRVTERVTKRAQAGACLHCHASVTVAYRRIGREAQGRPADAEALSAELDMPAVIEGFREVSTSP